MDQKVLAGIGNIYADEILHASRIHPERSAGTLSVAELERLHRAIGDVLATAIRLEGSSFDAGYRTVLGLEGGFLAQNSVYGRAGASLPGLLAADRENQDRRADRPPDLLLPVLSNAIGRSLGAFCALRQFGHDCDSPCPISVRVRTDHFAIVRSGDGIPGQVVHRVLDETDRAVHEQHVHAAWVVGTGRNHGDGAAAILIDVVVDAAGPVGRLGVRVDHGGAKTPPLTLPLPLLVVHW